MRTIKVGATGTQSRVAQACDRCRTKKVRCDGNRPCCTQCARVGFECQTSDKLSRRSFPRGYTESLEDRVRALEAEVRDLKDLLDRKDEEIDVLSRRRPFSPQYQRMASSIAHSEGVIHVQPSSSQYTSPKSNSKPYTALSSTQGFVDVFTDRLVSEAKLNSKLPTTSLAQRAAPVTHAFPNQALKIPSRFLTDQLINIFFQEWAPMYPVVHRSAILKAYELFLNNAESLEKDVAALAQLNLIFGIAALSSNSKSRTEQHPGLFENWAAPLEYLSSKTSVASVQCFILAQMYCMTKGEHRRLLRYRAIAVDICHQLGLYHNENGAAFNLLETETRKKVFWCQYVLDRFGIFSQLSDEHSLTRHRFCAALTGLPVLLNESDVQTEYPMDVDDENLSETEVLPTLPGQPTRISSALALFRASRILTKILEETLPSRFDYVVHTSKMRSVADQLDEWLQNLPPHLRIEFIRDKPSMDITGSRPPLLLLVYYFMRSLIHRPAVCFAEEHLRSSSILALSDCSKHIIQILELLDERRLCLSFSINRKELILVSGIGLLWQVLEVKPDRKLSEKTQNLLTTAIEQLKLESPAAAAELSAICNTLLSANTVKRGRTYTKKRSFNMSAATQKPSKSSKRQSLKSRLTGSANLEQLIAASSSQRSTISDATPPLALPSLLSPSWHTLPDSEDHVDRWHSSLDLGTDARQVSAFPSLGYYDPRAMPCPSSPDANTGAIVMADWENVLSEPDPEYLEAFTGPNGVKGLSADPGSFESIAAGHSRLSEDDTLAIPEQLIDLHDLSPEAWSQHAEGAELP